ncbi:5-oxoprolinase subunit PxpB [Ferdinandcohnia sp. Marseille-Q9671]
MDFDILPVGDMALQVYYHLPASDTLQRRIQQTTKQIEKKHIFGITELVPSYQSITVYYNPILTTYQELTQIITEVCKEVPLEGISSSRKVILLPTCYGGEWGEDLEHVATSNNLTTEEVVTIHSSMDYLIYMIGFLPGFPYLKGLSNRIHTPRLSSPRLVVPKGAVGIGGDQTGVYPLESPGGWNLLGRTPIPLFDPVKRNPFLLRAGDYLRFIPISSNEFYEIENLVKDNRYQVEVVEVENNRFE